MHFLTLFSFLLICTSLFSKEPAHDLITHDLVHWKIPKGNDQYNWYVVEDGVLQLRSSPNRKHSVLKTKKVFTDFHCSFEFRFIEGNIDSGIELRNNDQIQIGISGSLKRDMTGSSPHPTDFWSKKGFILGIETSLLNNLTTGLSGCIGEISQ